MNETKQDIIDKVAQKVSDKAYQAFYKAMKLPYQRVEGEDNLLAAERHIKNMSNTFAGLMKGVVTDIYENMDDYTKAPEDNSLFP